MSRSLLRPLLAITSLALLACSATAQRERDRDTWNTAPNSVDVSGEVRFADRVGPAANVAVRLESLNGGLIDQMTTDSHGRFRFAGLQRGQYVVTVSAPCFISARQQAELILVFRAYLSFELTPDTASPTCQPADAHPAAVLDVRVPPEAQREFERGRAALGEKKLKEGLEHLHKAVNIYPDFLAAYLLLGSAYVTARQLPDAEAAISRAAELAPRSASTLISLGEVRRQRKHYVEAEKALLEGLKLDDALWQGHFALGRLYLEQNEVIKAAPHFGRTLQLKPDFAEAHLFSGNLLLKVGEPARALVEYEEYLRLAPDGQYAAQARELVGKLKQALASRKNYK